MQQAWRQHQKDVVCKMAADVVFFSSLRSPQMLTSPIIDEFTRSFKIVHPLPCDVPLGDHPAQFSMLEKYPRMQKGMPSPYIDAAGCKLETEIEEGMFHAIVEEQQKSKQ